MTWDNAPPGHVLLTLVEGVEGTAVYLNNCRVSGPKPWGGGSVVEEWAVRVKDVLRAIRYDAALKVERERNERLQEVAQAADAFIEASADGDDDAIEETFDRLVVLVDNAPLLNMVKEART